MKNSSILSAVGQVCFTFPLLLQRLHKKMLWNIKTSLGYHVFSRQYKRLDDMHYFPVTSKVPNIVQIFNKKNFYIFLLHKSACVTVELWKCKGCKANKNRSGLVYQYIVAMNQINPLLNKPIDIQRKSRYIRKKEIRVLPTGVEPMTFRLLVRMLYHWATAGDSVVVSFLTSNRKV